MAEQNKVSAHHDQTPGIDSQGTGLQYAIDGQHDAAFAAHVDRNMQRLANGMNEAERIETSKVSVYFRQTETTQTVLKEPQYVPFHGLQPPVIETSSAAPDLTGIQLRQYRLQYEAYELMLKAQKTENQTDEAKLNRQASYRLHDARELGRETADETRHETVTAQTSVRGEAVRQANMKQFETQLAEVARTVQDSGLSGKDQATVNARVAENANANGYVVEERREQMAELQR